MELFAYKICYLYGVKPENVKTGGRKQGVSTTRKLIIHLAKREFGMPEKSIAKMVGLTERTIKRTLKTDIPEYEYCRRAIT